MDSSEAGLAMRARWQGRPVADWPQRFGTADHRSRHGSSQIQRTGGSFNEARERVRFIRRDGAVLGFIMLKRQPDGLDTITRKYPVSLYIQVTQALFQFGINLNCAAAWMILRTTNSYPRGGGVIKGNLISERLAG